MYLTSFTFQNILQLVFYLAVLIGVLFITYYVTKWIAGYQKNQGINQNFEVIETLKVTNNKFLQIVRVGKDDYYVIAIGKDEIHMLGKLDREQITFISKSSTRGGFSDILTSFKNNMNVVKDDDIERDKGESSDED